MRLLSPEDRKTIIRLMNPKYYWLKQKKIDAKYGLRFEVKHKRVMCSSETCGCGTGVHLTDLISTDT